MPPPRYILELDADQARALKVALDVWSRCAMGQFKAMVDPCDPFGPHMPEGMRAALLEQTDRMADLWRSHDLPARSEADTPWGSLAWDLHQVIRHRLAWDRMGNPPQRIWSGPNTMVSVEFDDPMATSGRPLAIMERFRYTAESFRYRLDLDEDQAKIAKRSLMLWARCSMGQFKEALEPCEPYAEGFPRDLALDLRDLGEAMERIWAQGGMPTGIRAAKGALAWEMFQTIRHRLAWDRAGNPPQRTFTGPTNMAANDFDLPMPITGKPLPGIRRVEPPTKPKVPSKRRQRQA